MYGADGAAAETVKPVKYIFLFIGDGMATPQRMMTDLYLKSIGKKEGLLMNRLPVQGFATTYSATSLITDSAASAIASSGAVASSPAEIPSSDTAFPASRRRSNACSR